MLLHTMLRKRAAVARSQQIMPGCNLNIATASLNLVNLFQIQNCHLVFPKFTSLMTDSSKYDVTVISNSDIHRKAGIDNSPQTCPINSTVSAVCEILMNCYLQICGLGHKFPLFSFTLTGRFNIYWFVSDVRQKSFDRTRESESGGCERFMKCAAFRSGYCHNATGYRYPSLLLTGSKP